VKQIISYPLRSTSTFLYDKVLEPLSESLPGAPKSYYHLRRYMQQIQEQRIAQDASHLQETRLVSN